MTAIFSTTNHHQIHLDDHKPFMPSSSSSSSLMEKTNQDPPPPPHHQPLKCPRCDSSNTKFCYYNNYSLSQPRHFCKACKRYWTRGGTLRNVPVGGGCRKNKRPKRVSSSGADGASSAVSAAATANPSGQLPQIDLSNRMHNPLFYNPVELNFPFSSYSSARVSSDTFDLHSQMNGLGLGFSSGLHEGGYKNGFRPIQDVISNSTSSSSPFSAAGGTNNNRNNSNIFFGSSSSTMASLLASSLHQQKFGDTQDPKSAPGFMPYEDPGKEMKPERENGSVWNPNPNLNPIEQINSSDPSSLLWNTWFDPSNLGSSVPSLI